MEKPTYLNKKELRGGRFRALRRSLKKLRLTAYWTAKMKEIFKGDK